MEGIFDRLGRKKHKRSNGTIPPSRQPERTYSVRRVLSIKPKSRPLASAAVLRQHTFTPNRSSFEAGSAEHLFARGQHIPPENDVNALFNSMLERRGIHDEKIKQSMEHWGVEKKWLMIHQDHQAELLASGVKQSRLQNAVAERASIDISRLPTSHVNTASTSSPLSPIATRYHNSPGGPAPTKSTSSPIKLVNTTSTTTYNNSTNNTANNNIATTNTNNTPYPTSPTLKRSRSIVNLSPVKTTSSNNDHYFDTYATDHNTPEFFVRKFLDPNLRSVTPKIASSLEVSLRTRSIDWVVKFIHLKGFHVLSYALDYLNHNTEYRRDVALELEVEIVKCIKAIVNTKAGGKEAMDHPEYIHAVVFSIICPQWQTRKMVCELLAFLCYLNGHEHVVRGFELLKKFKKTLGLYDSWMRELLRTMYNGDGKLRSERLPESHLLEYSLSNMILVNALTKIPSDVNYRIYMRNQFNAAGLQSTILPKLEALDYDLLDIQIESYKELTENDMDDAFGEDLSQNSDFSQPSELFDRALENISDSARGTEYFISVMKHFLWIKGDPETKSQFYHMISIIVQQIVMDRRPHENSDDFASTFGMAVGTVIQNFNDLERLKQVEKEADELREQYEQLLVEKDQLHNEVQKLRILPSQMENEAQNQRNIHLKKENDSLRDVLKTSKETIAMLQERLASAEVKEKRYSNGTLVLTEDWKVSQRRSGASMDDKSSPSKLPAPWLSPDVERMENSHHTMGSSTFGFGNFHIPFFGKKNKKPRAVNASVSPTLDRRSIDSAKSSSNNSGKSLSRRSASMEPGSNIFLAPPPPPPPPPMGSNGKGPISTITTTGTGGAPPPPSPPPPPPAPGLMPPALGNGPPPPPPPPPSQLNAAPPNVPAPPTILVPLRKEIHNYPQTKLKNFQWKKLDARDAEKTIWKMDDNDDASLEEALKENGAFEKIEALFPAKVNTFLEKRLAQTNKKSDVQNDSIKFLSKDKNRNINIVIFPKIKHFDSYKDVRDHILAMDDKLCTETFLINLITYCPSREDDLVTMQKFLDSPEEDCQKLDLPEQFTIEMMRIYRYETRIKFMLFRLQYWEKFEQLRKSLGVVLDASNALRNSKALKKLLQLILLLGNYMNGSSQQGGAFGMKIDSINKLADTKASDESQLTLLHCLVGIVRRQFPLILESMDDLKDINEATRVMASISDTVQQYTEMRQGLKQLGLELEAHWPNPADVKKEENDVGAKEGDVYTDDPTAAEAHADGSNEDEEQNDEDEEYKEDEEKKEDPKEDTEEKEEEEKGSANQDRFKQVMEEYCNSANDRFEELEALYVNVDVKWKDIMIYYGENPKIMRPDEFFSIFSRFMQSWKTATAEELKYTERMEREEKRKRDLEEKRKAFLRSKGEYSDCDSQTLSTVVEDNDRRVMDDLMEQLRSGRGENKMKQRRVRERLKRLKKEEDQMKSVVEKKKPTRLSIVVSRRDSVSSSGSSVQMPAISAEDLLRSLQQEDE